MNENRYTPELRFEGFTEPWKERKLGDVAEIVGGGTPDTSNPDYWDGSIDWYSPVELGDQIYADRSVRRITDEGYANCSAKMLPAGRTILFTSRAGIGNTAILRRPACTNQGFQSIVIHDDVDVYFLYTQSTQMKQWAEKKASGSTFLEISGKQLAEMPLRFPRFEEQEKIGIYFQHLDSFIALQQRKYERLQHLKHALLLKMFPKPGELVPELRFNGFTEPWEERKLGEIGEVKTGNTPSTANENYYSKKGTPWITPTDIRENGTYSVNKHLSTEGMSVAQLAPAGSILCTCIASIGKNTFTETTCGFNQQINALIPAHDTFDSYFLFFESALWSVQMKSNAASGTMQIVNKTEFSKLEAMIPSLPEQKIIGTFFSNLDSLITLHQRKYERLKRLKQALLRKMFV